MTERLMNYELTQHARDVMEERGIPLDWFERVLTNPTLTEPSLTDPELESRFARIPSSGIGYCESW